MISRKALLSTLILGGFVCSSSFAQNKIDWGCVSSGGGTSGAKYINLTATIGQPAVGFEKTRGTFHWVGYWSGDIPTPTVVSSIADAKKLADGEYVSASGRIAASAIGDFGSFFYVEDYLRMSGIRVAVPPGAVSELARGSIVSVMGTLGTASNGERQFTSPIVIVTSTRAPLAPFGMTNRSIGGSDIGRPPWGQIGVSGGFGLNNTGLLIKSCGRVTSTGTGYVMINDGSGPVMVDTTALASQPTVDSYITVIGISSLNFTGEEYQPLILPRNGGDIIGL